MNITRTRRFSVRVGKGWYVLNFETYESLKKVNEYQCCIRFQTPRCSKTILYYTWQIYCRWDVENNSSNKTYTATTLCKEIVANHKSVLSSFDLSTKDDDCDVTSIYWIPKLHKNTYKQRYIAFCIALDFF